MNAIAGTARYAIVAGIIVLSHPAAAFYSQVKPGLKVGVDCVGQISLLAPKLTACTLAGARTRIWCPDGKVFEGESDGLGTGAALARSLCNMAQVP